MGLWSNITGRRAPGGIDHALVLAALPVRNQLVTVAPLPGAPPQPGLRLSAPRRLGMLQKLFGMHRKAGAARDEGLPAATRKSFDLDELGAQVWELCNGRNTVEKIIREFAAARRLNQREAQVAVMAFLRTLVRRNLIVLAGTKSQKKPRRKRG